MARKTGTPMSYATISPRTRRRVERARRAEERRWAAQSGPVRIYYRPPDSVDPPARYPDAGAAG